MKLKSLNIFLFTLLVISCFPGSNKDQSSIEYLEIPFELINHRIIVEAIINGKKGRFVFDTGSTESYLDIKVNNLRRAGFTITPYKDRKRVVKYFHLNNLTFGDSVLRTNSYVINRSDFLKQCQRDGYDGILGIRSFEGYLDFPRFNGHRIKPL